MAVLIPVPKNMPADMPEIENYARFFKQKKVKEDATLIKGASSSPFIVYQPGTVCTT
jgi:hypothetical protein